MSKVTLESVCLEANTELADIWKFAPWSLEVGGVTWHGATDGRIALFERTAYTLENTPPPIARTAITRWFDQRTHAGEVNLQKWQMLLTSIKPLKGLIALGQTLAMRLVNKAGMLPIGFGDLRSSPITWIGPAGQGVYTDLLNTACQWVSGKHSDVARITQNHALQEMIVATAATHGHRLAVVMPARIDS